MKDIRGLYVNEDFKSLFEWFQGTDKSLRVFYILRSCGKDRYSRMKLEELRNYVPLDVREFFDSKRLLSSEDCALRWYLMGLSKEGAIKKAEVEANVSISKYVKIVEGSR